MGEVLINYKSHESKTCDLQKHEEDLISTELVLIALVDFCAEADTEPALMIKRKVNRKRNCKKKMLQSTTIEIDGANLLEIRVNPSDQIHVPTVLQTSSQSGFVKILWLALLPVKTPTATNDIIRSHKN